MVKAVIFDIDNTLFDFVQMNDISSEAAIDAMLKAGLGVSKKKALERLRDLHSELGLEDPQIFQKFLIDVIGHVDYGLLGHGVNAYRKKRIGHLKPYPGAVKVLKTLKKRGFVLGIISDAPKINAWLRLTAMDLDDYFDVVITKDDVKAEKDTKKPFLVMMKHLKIDPKDCLMIGDRASRDVKMAKESGMLTAFARYGSNDPDVKCDYVLDDIMDVLRVV